ncbi:hypothetical protein [Oceanobacillus sp. CFH 90083]|uniref:hypothetical protein n=1 Tax=Oceanobacillus sp. CFH 90083 TaxID=2592336 RepID=UPI00128CDB17|nr:hypothetical protein [Oceanobacillus sp. CFH 90083]
MAYSNSTLEEKLDKCESNYLTYTHIFLYFLTDYMEEVRKYTQIGEIPEKQRFERQLLSSLTSLEKLHYHFFHQQELLEEIYHQSDTSFMEQKDVSKKLVKEAIREEIFELKKQIQQHSFSLDTYKNRCLDCLHLLLSYYPKVTIIRDTSPRGPWFSSKKAGNRS